MSVQRVYLVIGADRSVRAAKRPRVGVDEVAVAIDLMFPDSWGGVIEHVEVDVPDFAPAVAVVGIEDDDEADGTVPGGSDTSGAEPPGVDHG